MGNMNILDLRAWIEALYAAGMQGQVPRLWIEPYAYSLTFTGLAPAATATQILTINSNADFVLTGISHHANVAAAAQNSGTKTVPLVRASIVDTGSARPFFNTAADLENISANIVADGRGLPFPRWLAGNTSIQVQLTNYDAAATYGIELLFNGVSVRRYSEPLATVI